ncbi:MAG: TPM domain-containing protein [Acetobacteraceae bacterium]|nr:TPM domain-containing protein [Acetobacteraceae bacterium]
MARSVTAASLAFPALTGRVVDEAALLSTNDLATLTASLAELEAKTTNQLVIVTLKSLQGTTIEDYGYQLGRRWKIGQKDRDTGVLLLVAPAEKVVRIEVGYGLEGTLTDAMTKTIIETALLPAFRTGDFAGGIKNGANQIIQALGAHVGSQARPAVRNSAPAQGTAGTPVWLVIVLGVGGVGLLIYCAVAGGAMCRAVMQILILAALSGRRGSSNDRSSPFSGGGGSFGGGGSSGRW